MSRVTGYIAIGLVANLAIGVLASCIRIPEDPACGHLRNVALSADHNRMIRAWIDEALARPEGLVKADRRQGVLSPDELRPGLDWDALGLARDGLVEFYGRHVDYSDLRRSDVEAVIISDDLGYKLIFKLDPATTIEARLWEASKKPYSAVTMETLPTGEVLVCQVND